MAHWGLARHVTQALGARAVPSHVQLAQLARSAILGLPAAQSVQLGSTAERASLSALTVGQDISVIEQQVLAVAQFVQQAHLGLNPLSPVRCVREELLAFWELAVAPPQRALRVRLASGLA